jgi:arginyl-tRNA synthetase
MGARISSMLRKRESELEVRNEELGMNSVGFSLLVSDPEWELLKTLAAYPQAVSDAASSLDPSRLAAYLYELSRAFSRFYHDCPILSAENPDLSAARLALSQAVLRVLKDAMRLTCIPFLEVM